MNRMKTVAAQVQQQLGRFVKEEDGVGVVEIVLIVVILVGLVLIFKEQITEVVEDALDSFSEDASTIYD